MDSSEEILYFDSGVKGLRQLGNSLQASSLGGEGWKRGKDAPSSSHLPHRPCPQADLEIVHYLRAPVWVFPTKLTTR